MANLQKVNFDYIKKWEGGLSHNQKDSASRNPVPSTPAHPNPKGIAHERRNNMGSVGCDI
jgi:hypothetical protein